VFNQVYDGSKLMIRIANNELMVHVSQRFFEHKIAEQKVIKALPW